MKLLFVTENEVSPMHGGTERVTAVLSAELTRLGHECHLAYCRPCTLPLKADFAGTLLINTGSAQEQVGSYILSGGFDAVISNLVDIRYKRLLLPVLYHATRRSAAAMLACYHAMPGEELLGNTPSNSIWRIMHHGHIKDNLKDLLLAISPRALTETLFRGRIRSRYRLMHDHSDRTVLLSERFFPEFARLGGLPDFSRLRCAHNSLSLDCFLRPEELDAKRRTVLVLSRLDEKPKRLSRVLKAWRLICRDDSCRDWTLKIVGGGPDEAYYRRMAESLSLRSVSFEGRQEEIIGYYREASIFLMTSAFEGWGLTLTEAQQMGAVPVVMDTYASLRDIITDGVDGCITPASDIKAFASRLKWLMYEDDARKQMALAGLSSCRRFPVKRSADEILSIINEVCPR